MSDIFNQILTQKIFQVNRSKRQQNDNKRSKYFQQKQRDETLFIKPKGEYILNPNLLQLKKMDYKELKEVTQFSISNQYGKIQWLGKTDLTNVNLQRDIYIQQNKIEVYPDNIYNDKIKKPEIGHKLNKQCILYYYNIKKSNEQTLEQFIDQIKKECIQQQAKFIEYDEQNFILKIKVVHFTKYEFSEYCDSSDDKSDEDPHSFLQSQDIQILKNDSKNQQHTFKHYSELDQIREQDEEEIQSSKKQTEEVTELREQPDIQQLLSQPQSYLTGQNKKMISMNQNQQRVIKEDQINSQKKNISVILQTKEDNDVYNYKEKINNDFQSPKQLEKDLEFIEEELRQLESQQFNEPKLDIDGKLQQDVINQSALINKILQYDKITLQSQGFTKDIETPACFMSDNIHLMLDNKIFSNHINYKQVNQYEVLRKANDIMVDILHKLLSDLTIFFCENEKQITYTLERINQNEQRSLNKQDLFLILFMFNFQDQLKTRKFAFWYLYVKLINDLFLGTFFSLYESVTDIKDFKFQLKLFEDFYINKQQFTQIRLKDICRRQISNWCHFAEDFIKDLNQNQIQNHKLFECEYEFDVININKLLQPDQDCNIIKKTLIYKFKNFIKEEYELSIAQCFEQFKKQEKPSSNFLDKMFVEIMEIYLQSSIKNCTMQEVESFIFLDGYCSQNKIYHLFQHLLFQTNYFYNLNSVNNKTFKSQYQWNFKNLEYFCKQNEFNMEFIILSNLMINHNFLDANTLKKQALYQFGNNVILQKKGRIIIKYLYKTRQLNYALSQAFLYNNNIEQYLQYEQSNDEKLNIYLKQILQKFINPQQKDRKYRLNDLFNIYEKYLQKENKIQYKILQTYLEFLEAFNQQNYNNILENFKLFMQNINKCYKINKMFFFDHEDILRDMQTQLFEKIFQIQNSENSKNQNLMVILLKLQQQRMKFFVNRNYMKELANNMIKLTN